LSKDSLNKPMNFVQAPVVNAPVNAEVKAEASCYGQWMQYLFWFVIITIIAWFLIFSLKPNWVLKKNCGHKNNSDCDSSRSDDNSCHDGCNEVDQWKVLIAAVIIGLIGIFIIWLFQWACRKC
jgi:hypothetical protein